MKESIEVETSTLETPNELLSNFEASGITFLNEYHGKEVTQHTYKLKEKDIEGECLKAIKYEKKEKVIGGYGVLPNWEPGIFNLDENKI